MENWIMKINNDILNTNILKYNNYSIVFQLLIFNFICWLLFFRFHLYIISRYWVSLFWFCISTILESVILIVDRMTGSVFLSLFIGLINDMIHPCCNSWLFVASWIRIYRSWITFESNHIIPNYWINLGITSNLFIWIFLVRELEQI